MKTLGALLICFSIGVRTGQYFNIDLFDYAFVITTIGILLILFDNSPKKGRIPKMPNPPAPPEPLIQCHKLSIDNSNKALAILELLREELKDIAPPKKFVGITPHGRLYRPEFPKDRT